MVLTSTVACEVAARRGWLPYWLSRKLLHLVAVGACAVAALVVPHEVLIPIVGVALLGLGWLVASGRLMRDETGRPAWGILWFPVAYLLLLWGCSDAQRVAFGMAVLAVCDPAAAIVGKWRGRRVLNLSGDPKTVAGALGFIVSFLVLGVLTVDVHWWWFLPLAGIYLAAWELLGSKGLDNFFLPLAAAWLYPSLTEASGAWTYLLATGLLAIPFGYWTVGRGSLTVGGAVATALLATTVSAAAGPRWLLPLLLFFGTSVAIGRFFPTRSAAADDKHRQPRDAVQVAANGLIYMVVAAYGPFLATETPPTSLPWRELLLVAAAVATADTWASELGQYFRGTTYDLLRWRPVPVGLSGGVSGAGSGAALAGAALIAALGFGLIEEYSWGTFILVTGLGVAGMFLDSLLGSSLQARYRSPDGSLTDARPDQQLPDRGYAWMTNDLVNLLALAATVVLSALLLSR